MMITKRASITLEFAFLIAVFAVAAGWAFYYFSGAVCGRWKESMESGFGYVQYDPGKTQIIGETTWSSE